MPKVRLRKLRSSDEPYFQRWWNDMVLRSLTSGSIRMLSSEEISDSFNAMLRDPAERHFMILVGEEAVGHINLAQRADGWHETQIVIGESEFRDRGHGTTAIRQLLRKAKEEGIRKIYLEVRPDNARAIAAYKKCGFVRRGIVHHDSPTLPETLRMELE